MAGRTAGARLGRGRGRGRRGYEPSRRPGPPQDFWKSPIPPTLLLPLSPPSTLPHLPGPFPLSRPSCSLPSLKPAALAAETTWGPRLNSFQPYYMVNSTLGTEESLVLTSWQCSSASTTGPPPTPSALLSSLAPSPGGPDVLEPQQDTETQSRPG